MMGAGCTRVGFVIGGTRGDDSDSGDIDGGSDGDNDGSDNALLDDGPVDDSGDQAGTGMETDDESSDESPWDGGDGDDDGSNAEWSGTWGDGDGDIDPCTSPGALRCWNNFGTSPVILECTPTAGGGWEWEPVGQCASSAYCEDACGPVHCVAYDEPPNEPDALCYSVCMNAPSTPQPGAECMFDAPLPVPYPIDRTSVLIDGQRVPVLAGTACNGGSGMIWRNPTSLVFELCGTYCTDYLDGAATVFEMYCP